MTIRTHLPIVVTRMHSSRMRTVRSSSHVYPSMHWELCIPACTGRGGVCLGGVCPGGVCPGGVSQHALRQTPLPMDRMTDRCKNITLCKLRLQTVIRMHSSRMRTTRTLTIGGGGVSVKRTQEIDNSHTI